MVIPMQDDKINEDDFEDLDFEDFDDDDLDDLDNPADDSASDLNSADDDLIADDLGDDFPEDDDFSDEDWGDEDSSNMGSNKALKKGGTSKLSPKIILPLAIGAVALGAGGFYFMQSGGSGTAPVPQQMPIEDMASADTGLDIAEDTLPMPAPMASPTEEEFNPDYMQDVREANVIDNGTANGLNSDGMFAEPTAEEPQDENFAQDGVLTPMPSLQVTEEESTVPLDSLGLDEAPDTSSDTSGQPLSLADIENNAIEAVDSSPAGQDSALFEPPQISSDETTDTVADIGIPSEAAADLSLASEDATVNISDTQTTPDFSDTNMVAGAAPEADVSQYEEKISALEDNLSDKDSAIAQLNSQIEALKQQLSVRERDLESVRNSLEALEKQATAAAPSPVAETPRAVAKKPSTSAPVSKPPTRASANTEIKPKWELRAAQPGRAYIGIIGSKDVQVIEAGDTLQGIGKVQSIALENGIWVVKGTNGSIKQ